MPFKFFHIPVGNAEIAERDLNGFVRSHRVVSVERRFVERGENSFWSLCVDYLDGTPAASDAKSSFGKPKIDYREVLSPEDFAVFAKLRDQRKRIATEEAVPVYMVFTNGQLAEIVRVKAKTKSALEQIEGVGGARVDKYGPRILEFLSSQWNEQHAPNGKPV